MYKILSVFSKIKAKLIHQNIARLCLKNVSPLGLKAMVQYQIGALHSICVHGDSPKALEFVKKIRSSLETEGIKVVAMGK